MNQRRDMRSTKKYLSCVSLWCYGMICLLSSPLSVSSSDGPNDVVVKPLKRLCKSNDDGDGGFCDHDNVIGDVAVDINDDESSSLPWWKDIDVKLVDIWDILQCEDVFEENDRPVHSEATWLFLRGAYVGIVDPSETSIHKNQLFHNAFQPGLVEVKGTEEKGRGVYALRTIKEGELVWNDVVTACFENGMDYRKYLASIPSDLACDVFEWAFADDDDGICIDLNDGAYINHSSLTESHQHKYITDNDTPNIGVGSNKELYATKDISPGEELLIDYMSFEDEDNWELYGLGKWEEE